MEEIVKLTKKQKKAIRKAPRREAKAQRLNKLLIEYKLAAKLEAYQQAHEGTLDVLADLDLEKYIAQKAERGAGEAVEEFTLAHPNLRPLDVVHEQILGEA